MPAPAQIYERFLLLASCLPRTELALVRGFLLPSAVDSELFFPFREFLDEIEFEGLIFENFPRLGRGHLFSFEIELLANEFAHGASELTQIAIAEWFWQFEVVVESILNRRPNTKFGLGELLQHRHRQKMGKGVTDILYQCSGYSLLHGKRKVKISNRKITVQSAKLLNFELQF